MGQFLHQLTGPAYPEVRLEGSRDFAGSRFVIWISDQFIEGGNDPLFREPRGRKSETDAEVSDAAERVELIMRHRLDEVRDSRLEGLGTSADAAMIDDRRRTWQDLAEGDVGEMADVSRQG